MPLQNEKQLNLRNLNLNLTVFSSHKKSNYYKRPACFRQSIVKYVPVQIKQTKLKLYLDNIKARPIALKNIKGSPGFISLILNYGQNINFS